MSEFEVIFLNGKDRFVNTKTGEISKQNIRLEDENKEIMTKKAEVEATQKNDIVDKFVTEISDIEDDL